MAFVVLAVIYAVMRFYIYLMMITFDLSVKKLLKNALIFVMLGLKRNLVALIGLFILFGTNFVLIILGLSVGFSLPLILPIFYLPALVGFITAYAAWPNIKRYMIDAYDNGSTPAAVTAAAETEEDDLADQATPPSDSN